MAAIEPVADRLLRRFKAAKEAYDTAKAKQTDGPVKDVVDALLLFKRDLGTFVRVRFPVTDVRLQQHDRLRRSPYSSSGFAAAA